VGGNNRGAAAAIGAAAGAAVAIGATGARGAGAAAGAAWVTTYSRPALRMRTLRPSCSISNSASSCSRTRFRMSLRASRFITSNSQQVAWSRREDFNARIGHEHIVLQPCPTNSGHIGAGFDGADHSGPEELVGRREAR